MILEEQVALRKESVDRNGTMQIVVVIVHVALRKESVDRNMPRENLINSICVALRKESVDRNYRRFRAVQDAQGRSPQGERG